MSSKFSSNSSSRLIGYHVEKSSSESLNRISVDLQLINQRIIDLNGDHAVPTHTPKIASSTATTSPFVSGIRNVTQDSSRESDSYDSNRIGQLERLLEKLSELDRLVLRRTANDTPTSSLRRKSGTDLFHLPSHMQVIDRLFDLYAASRRPPSVPTETVVTATVGKGLMISGDSIGSPRSSNDGNTILQDKIVRLNKLLEESEVKCKQFETQASSLKKKVISLQSSLDEANTLNSKLKVSLSETERQGSDIEALKSELTTLKKSSEATMKTIVAVMTKKSLAFKHEKDSEAKHDMKYETFSLSAELNEAMIELDLSINGRIENLLEKIRFLTSVKETYESELNSYTLEKSMYKDDFGVLREQFEALKVAYNSLEGEFLVKKKADHDLHDQLQAAQAKIAGLEHLANQLPEMNTRLLAAENGKIELEMSRNQLIEELESYKRLTESLKESLRSMNKRDGRDLLDTFEEVMKEELMTMKTAFEAKLRAAKESAEETTKRNLLEIRRLQENSEPMELQRNTPSNKLNKS